MTDGDARERLLSDIWNRIRALTEDNVATTRLLRELSRVALPDSDVVWAMSAAS